MSTALDRLVSEKVMGWPVIDFAANAPKGGYIRAACAYRGSDHPTDRCGKWSPSTEIGAAWEVVEHLRKQRSATDKMDDPTWAVALNGSGDRWICDVSDWRGRLDVSACNKEACVAICLAALRAVGVPESEIQEATR